MRYRDIPQMTPSAGLYAVDVGWNYLAKYYYSQVMDYGLDVNPNFQRGNVWTEAQKTRFVEYILSGGKSGKDIYTNCPTWQGFVDKNDPKCWYVLVDGKQRIDAVIGYLSNEIKAFGHYHREYTDGFDIMQCRFRWHVNELKTINDVYSWYIDLNAGGTVHSEDEIERVRALRDNKVPYERITGDEAMDRAHMNRAAIVAAKEAEEQDQARQDQARLVTAAREAETSKRKKTRRR